MCALSVIYAYGAGMPGDFWNERQHLEAFQKLINEARKFDEATRQPECEDPAKEELLKDILAKIYELNKKDAEQILPH